jgi:hypothetical protein
VTNTDEPLNWRERTLAEITSVKPHFVRKHQWELTTSELAEAIILYVRFRHTKQADRVKVLRLVYGAKFPLERPQEGFVNPEDYKQEGLEFWINDNQGAFKTKNVPPAICLVGTYGFHHVLHKDRSPLQVNLTTLLAEIQAQYDKT